MLKLLAGLSHEDFKQAGQRVFDQVQHDFSKPIALFKSLSNEIDTSLFLDRYTRVLLPGPAPEDYAKIILESQVDHVFVPGLAFDLDANRLGRGGGYYDRCIKALRQNPNSPQIIGICLKQQLLESIPVEIHDQRVDSCVYA